MISAIVCIDLENGIGKDGELLFHLKEDLKNFKRLTEGKVIIYGSKTMKTFPNKVPLKNRTNIVLSEHMTSCPNAEVVDSIEKAIFVSAAYDVTGNDIFVIGGASVYEQFMPYIDRVYLTRVYKTGNADTFFPTLSEDQWTLESRSQVYEEDGVAFCIFTYKRIRNRKMVYVDSVSQKEKSSCNEFISKLNNWLRMKWIQADVLNWLPTASEVFEYFNKSFNVFTKDKLSKTQEVKESWDKYRKVDLSLIDPKKAKHLSKDYYEKNLILDMLLEVSYTKDSIKVFSALFPDEPFMDLHFVTQPYQCDKNTISAVLSVSGYYSGFEDRVLMEKVFEKAFSMSFSERFMLTSESFKREHPICPVCGSPLYQHERDDYIYYLCCEFCDWESKEAHTKYDLLDNYIFSCEKLFKKVKTESAEANLKYQQWKTILYSLEILKKTEKNVDEKEKLEKFIKFTKEKIE